MHFVPVAVPSQCWPLAAVAVGVREFLADSCKNTAAHAHQYTCKRRCTRIHAHVHSRVCTHMHTRARAHTRTHALVCTRALTHARTHAHTHTHTHATQTHTRTRVHRKPASEALTLACPLEQDKRRKLVQFGPIFICKVALCKVLGLGHTKAKRLTAGLADQRWGQRCQGDPRGHAPVAFGKVFSYLWQGFEANQICFRSAV